MHPFSQSNSLMSPTTPFPFPSWTEIKAIASCDWQLRKHEAPGGFFELTNSDCSKHVYLLESIVRTHNLVPLDRVFCPKICLFKTDGWHFGTEFLATQKTSISENYCPFKL